MLSLGVSTLDWDSWEPPCAGPWGWDLGAGGWLRWGVHFSSHCKLGQIPLLMSGIRQVKPHLDSKSCHYFLPHKLSTTQKHNGYCSAFLFIQLWLLNCCWSSLRFLIRIFCLISFSVSFNKVNTGWDLSKRIDPSPMNSEGCCIKHRSVSDWQYDAGWLSVIHVNSRDNLNAEGPCVCYLLSDNAMSEPGQLSPSKVARNYR